MASIAELLTERAKIDAQIKAEQERTKDFSPTERLADMLHETLCRHNHTDGCGWGYEKDWKTWDHLRYLNIASAIVLSWERVRSVTTSSPHFAETVVGFLSLVKNL